MDINEYINKHKRDLNLVEVFIPYEVLEERIMYIDGTEKVTWQSSENEKKVKSVRIRVHKEQENAIPKLYQNYIKRSIFSIEYDNGKLAGIKETKLGDVILNAEKIINREKE